VKPFTATFAAIATRSLPTRGKPLIRPPLAFGDTGAYRVRVAERDVAERAHGHIFGPRPRWIDLVIGGEAMPSVEDALQTQIANIERSSGRTMTEWRVLAQERGLAKHGEIVAWLKAETRHDPRQCQTASPSRC
jgi:hypothetical protein